MLTKVILNVHHDNISCKRVVYKKTQITSFANININMMHITIANLIALCLVVM